MNEYIAVQWMVLSVLLACTGSLLMLGLDRLIRHHWRPNKAPDDFFMPRENAPVFVPRPKTATDHESRLLNLIGYLAYRLEERRSPHSPGWPRWTKLEIPEELASDPRMKVTLGYDKPKELFTVVVDYTAVLHPRPPVTRDPIELPR